MTLHGNYFFKNFSTFILISESKAEYFYPNVGVQIIKNQIKWFL